MLNRKDVAKHFYYKMLQEDKIKNKIEAKFLKAEQRRNMKKIAKQWQINDSRGFDEFEDFDENEDVFKKQEIKQPKRGFVNNEEENFFDENTDKMIYYKKTLNNIERVIQGFFSNPKFLSKILKNDYTINITKISLNKAITKIDIYFNVKELEKTDVNELERILIQKKLDPQLDLSIFEESLKLTEEENVKKKEAYDEVCEILNHASSYISSHISKIISFKRLLIINFSQDKMIENVQKLFNVLTNINSSNSIEKSLTTISNKEKENLEHIIKTLKSDNYYKAEIIKKIENIKSKDSKNAIECLKLFKGSLSSICNLIMNFNYIKDNANSKSQQLSEIKINNKTLESLKFQLNFMGINEESINNPYIQNLLLIREIYEKRLQDCTDIEKKFIEENLIKKSKDNETKSNSIDDKNKDKIVNNDINGDNSNNSSESDYEEYESNRMNGTNNIKSKIISNMKSTNGIINSNINNKNDKRNKIAENARKELKKKFGIDLDKYNDKTMSDIKFDSELILEQFISNYKNQIGKRNLSRDGENNKEILSSNFDQDFDYNSKQQKIMEKSNEIFDRMIKENSSKTHVKSKKQTKADLFWKSLENDY